MPKETLKCPYCKHKFHTPVTDLHEDYTFIDKCDNCKRYLLVTLHADGNKPTIVELPKDYKMQTNQNAVQY